MSTGAAQTDAGLAARYAPILKLDRSEPYLPYALGYTVFPAAGRSPSSRFTVEPIGPLSIEYAIYYDWDIGHLYDLEHVWVHLDEQGRVGRVEASSHGGRLLMNAGAGLAEMYEGRPVVYVEAGKHAHWATPGRMQPADRQQLAALCGPLAGLEGVRLSNDFAISERYTASASDHRLARLKMQRDAFVPTHDFTSARVEPPLMPWPELAAAIPDRVRGELDRLRDAQMHLGAVFLDCGDTLVDERSEVREPGSEVVVRGELIPGAGEMVHTLKAAGYRLVLVADGPRGTFLNLLGQHDLWDLFDAHVISGEVGALKPDARMFETALAAAGLTRSDAWRCVMVGNNLSRDIKGAKALGISTVFMAWSTLRSHVPADADEIPDYRISSPAELPRLLHQIEALLPYRMPGCSPA